MDTFTNSPGKMITVNTIVILTGVVFLYGPLPTKMTSAVLPYIGLLYLIMVTLISLFYYIMSNYELSRKIILYSSLPLYIILLVFLTSGGRFR